MLVRHEVTHVIKLDPELMTFLNQLLDLQGGMTAAEVQAAKDRLTKTAERLESIEKS